MRPNFLVIGAMKAGTTSLHQYLAAHPQVFMSTIKETHFFVQGLTGELGRLYGWERGWAWYERNFEGAGGALAIGESSPSYTAYPLREGVPARIAAAIPDARFIYLLRHPIERAHSEYVHKWLNGLERRPFATALLEDPVYLDKSRYAAQIEQYLEWFPSERLLAVLSEDLRGDRQAALARIWPFLGVDPWPAGAVTIEEFHRNQDKEATSKLVLTARRLPGYQGVALHTPPAVRRAVRSLTKVRVDPRGTPLPDGVRRELHDRLLPDLARLRDLVPGAVERWGL